jgi:hypothetical protein
MAVSQQQFPFGGKYDGANNSKGKALASLSAITATKLQLDSA